MRWPNKFVYYWEGAGDNGEAVPFYKMEINGGFSDVTQATLLDKGMPIPLTPTYRTWLALVNSNRRCRRCFACIRDKIDFARHMETNHGVRMEVTV